MKTKLQIAIFVHGDPTRGGTIASEVKFLKHLYATNSEDCDFFLLTVNPSVTKRVIKERVAHYDFPHEVVPLKDALDINFLSKFNAIVTWVGHTNFYGGLLNANIIKLYQIVSIFTNDLNRPVFFRVNDSEGKVRDYRHMAAQRLEGNMEASFNANKENREAALQLVSMKEWNYDNCHWFANGAKEIYDWLPETLWDREDPAMRKSTRERIAANTVYLSDDIFFMVRHNYERFKGLPLQQEKDSFFYIGFFDTFNTKRAKAFEDVWKLNKHGIPVKIFGKGTENIKKIRGEKYSNVDIEEGWVRGDSPDFFGMLNRHIAYVFVGKGHSISRYIGKTVYDAVVARTPVVIYRPCDTNHICMTSDEMYFTTEDELKVIYDKLRNPEERLRILKEQAEDIFNRLPFSSFKFNTYNTDKCPRINDDDIAKLAESAAANRKIVSKAVELF